MCFTISIGLSALSSSRSKRLRASFSHLAINKLRQCFWMLKLCTHFYAYFPRHSFFCAHKYIVFEFSVIKSWYENIFISYSFIHFICSHLQTTYISDVWFRVFSSKFILLLFQRTKCEFNNRLNLGQQPAKSRKRPTFFQSISNQCQTYFPMQFCIERWKNQHLFWCHTPDISVNSMHFLDNHSLTL